MLEHVDIDELSNVDLLIRVSINHWFSGFYSKSLVWYLILVDPDQGKLEATQARMSSKVCCFIKINGELLFLLFYVATEV